MGALAYSESTGEVLARYPDGQAGLICRRAVGRACVLGVDIGALTQRAYNGRGEGIARSYVNAYEPSLDTLYAWLADFYVEGEPMPLLIDTAPPGKDVSIILTHDVDFTERRCKRASNGRRAQSGWSVGHILHSDEVRARLQR